MKLKLYLCYLVVITLLKPGFGQITYVTPTGNGLMDGSSWGNALNGNASTVSGYTKLAEALSLATPGCVVWVAEGTYYPSTDNDRDKSFPLPESVSLYGGFTGTESTPEQRDIAAHPTILSGNIGDPTLETDNTYHVLTTIGPYWYQHAFLNGLTITGGYAQDATLPNNAGQKWGGGIYSSHKLTIEYCRFHHNKAANGGGAIYIKDYGISSWMINELIVNHCQFDNNSLLTSARGGAIQVYRAYRAFPSTIQNTLFFNNNAFYGSAIHANGTCTLNNCLVANNSAQSGALVVEYGSGNIYHSTIVNNGGRGIFVMTGGNVQLKNSIVWGGGPVSGMSGTTFSAQHSCLEGGDTINGNINTDPLFVNPSTGIGSAFPGDLANWRLRWCSPCFNSGDSTLVYPGTSVDLDGQLRLLYSQTDMGAYELDTTGLIPNAVNYAATPVFVTDSAQYYGDGSSWIQAVAGNAESCKYPGQTLLYEAMRDAAPGTQLWLKKGIYKSSTTGNRNHFFDVNEGVLVYGGFEGTEADTSQRGNGITLFSGDFGLAGDSTDNARHVLKINAANATFSDTALLDRVQVCGGHADGSGEEANGAGIWVGTGTKLKLNDCKVERNSAKSVGSGIYTKPGSLLVMNNSEVSHNSQRTTSSGNQFYGNPGCGIYNQGKLIAVQSRFNHNRNASEGTAIYNADSLWMYHCHLDSNESIVTATRGGALSSAKYTRLFNCSLQYNKASILGGGAWNKDSSYLEMDSCQVSHNQCYNTGNGSGGGLHNDGQLVIYNTSLLHNQSKLDGGGLCNSSTGTAEIDRCTVAYNLASGGPVFSGGGGLYNGGTMHVNRTKICNNSTDKNGGGIYNPTTLRNSLVANNSKGGQYTVAGGIRLTEACQSIINSTIVNNNGQGIAAAYINNWGNLVNLADTFSIHNSICFGNEIQLAGNFQITHSCIEGGHPGQGNFFDNPVFQLPSNGYGANINGLNADWSLISCSPCIDRGDSSWLNNSDLLDITGSPRVFGTRVDMGAFELQENPMTAVNYTTGKVYISESTIPGGFGTAWSDTLSGNAPSCRYPGYTLLYEAMKDVPENCDLWVKNGTYKPCLDNDRQKSFEIKPGLKVFGGFAGGETALGERNVFENPTILSGNIGNPADSLDNSFHVVFAFGGDHAWSDSTIFNGLYIQEGNANYNCGNCLHKDIVGGGVYLEQNTRLYIENCTIRDNFGLGNYTTSPTLIGKLGGGAVYNQGNLTINKSRITRNTADKMGGAIFNLNNLRLSHTMIDSNRIHYSGSQYYSWGGGAIFNKESGYMLMDSCSLIGNTINIVHLPGGGIRNTGTMEFKNMNYFEGNSNGAISSDKSFSISNSKFLRNEGGLSCADTVVVTGCYFFGNNGSAISGGLHSTITNCVLDSNYTAISTSGISKVSNCTITRSDNKGFLTSSSGGIFNFVIVVTGNVGSGIRHEGDTLEVKNCLFENNLAAGGSGVALLSGYGKIENSIFRNNTGDAGSAIKNHGLLDVSNCLIVNNHSHRYGIIANVEDGKMNLYNSTIANNRFHILIPNTVFHHGTYYNDPGESHFNIRNSIIKSTNAGVFGYETNNTGTDSVAYSCVTGGFAGSGNIDADPAFVLEIPHNNYSMPPSSANWTLSACSPCIDAGNDTLVTDTTDLAWNTRIYNRVDMGAYELAYLNGLHTPEAHAIGRHQAVLTWKNRILPCRTAVFIKDTCCGSPELLPAGVYLPSANYTSGTQVNGWYCVFNGSGDSVTVTGLAPGTTYRVAIFNYLKNMFYDSAITFPFTTENIVFENIQTTYGEAAFTPVPVAASGIQDFTFVSSNPQVAVINGNQVQIMGAGTTVLSAIHSGNLNYLPDSASTLLTVAQAPLLCILHDKQRLYGMPNPPLTYHLNGFVNGEDSTLLDVLPTPSCPALPSSSVGQYPITASGGIDNNYLFIYQNGTLQINPALLTATANDTSRMYGSSNPAFTYTIQGFMNGEDSAVLLSPPVAFCPALPESPVGTYPIILSGGVATNYNFTYIPGTLTVYQAGLNVAAHDTIRPYGDPNPPLVYTVTGFVNGDDISTIDLMPQISTPAVMTSPAGTYPIIVCCAADSNYTFSYTQAELTVNQSMLEVWPQDTSRIYGSPNPTFSALITGFKNNENTSVIDTLPTLSSPASTISPAGIYPIESCCAGDNNYSFVYHQGTLTVEPALLTAQAGDTSRLYGESNPPFTIEYTGFVNGDGPAVIDTLPQAYCAANSYSPAGWYPIDVWGGWDNNYTFIYLPGTLIVNKAPLQVIPSDTLREYGEINPVFALGYEGFVNNDDPSDLTLEPLAQCEADTLSPVGLYEITTCCGEDENYEFIYHHGELEIIPAQLFVYAADTFRMAGMPNPWFRLIYQGFKNGDDTLQLYVAPTGSSPADSLSPPGHYPIYTEGGQAQNYMFQYGEGVLTVTINTAINPPNRINPAMTYPNPFKDRLTVSFPTKHSPAILKLVDASGRILLKKAIAADLPLAELSLQHLASGEYLIIIDYRTSSQILKVIKK